MITHKKCCMNFDFYAFLPKQVQTNLMNILLVFILFSLVLCGSDGLVQVTDWYGGYQEATDAQERDYLRDFACFVSF